MIKAKQDRILVKEIDVENITLGGIILPNSAEKSVVGEVLSVGPGAYNDKDQFIVPGVCEGDKVIFIQGAGEKVEIEKQYFLFLRESEIIAVVR